MVDVRQEPARSTATSASRLLAGFLLLGALLGVLLTLSRVLGPDQHQLVLLASFGAYGVAGWAVLGLVAGLVLRRAVRSGRRRALPALVLALSLVGTTLHAAWLAPFLHPDGVEVGGPPVVVATLNLRIGQADTAAVSGWLARRRPDVVVLTEVTPAARVALEADPTVGPAGTGPWPHRAGATAPGSRGTLVLSAHPLGPVTTVALSDPGYRVRVDAPVPFVLTAAHAAYPLPSQVPWLRDLRLLRDDVRAVARESDVPHLVVGDLNSTLDHRALRDVLAAGRTPGGGVGLRDAAEQAGSGWQPTWPRSGADTGLGVRAPVPLLALDHVLVSRGLVATRTATDAVAGTDHLALVVRLGEPRTLGRR